MTTKRCTWVGTNDALMLQYHDREWGVPVHDDRKHFEFLVQQWDRAAQFQNGAVEGSRPCSPCVREACMAPCRSRHLY